MFLISWFLCGLAFFVCSCAFIWASYSFFALHSIVLLASQNLYLVHFVSHSCILFLYPYHLWYNFTCTGNSMSIFNFFCYLTFFTCLCHFWAYSFPCYMVLKGSLLHHKTFIYQSKGIYFYSDYLWPQSHRFFIPKHVQYLFQGLSEFKLDNYFKWSYDPRSYESNFCNCVKKPENFRTSTGFEPVTSRYRCDALTNWAMKPLTLGAGHLWVLISPWGMSHRWNDIWNGSYMNCGYEIKCSFMTAIVLSPLKMFFDFEYKFWTWQNPFNNIVESCVCFYAS